MPKITFLPSNKTIFSKPGEDLLTVLREAGIFMPTSCAGEGVCGLCRVKIIKGTIDSEITSNLSKEDWKEGFRLACRTIIKNDDITVEIPSATQTYDVRIESSIDEVEQKYIASKFKLEPLVEKIYLELPKPTSSDNLSDLERIFVQIRKKRKNGRRENYQTSLANLRILPSVLRDADFKITATVLNPIVDTDEVQILHFEPGDRRGKNFGVVVDVGTTTISAQLINLCTGEILSTKAAFNKQLQWGEDVITRIIYAASSSGRGLEELHQAVAANINELVASLVENSRITLADINAVCCAGNTTMIHLLLKIDPTNIRKEPYTPAVNEVPVVNAAECGIDVNPKAVLICLPSVGSYVGADISAGVLASGMYKKSDISLLIDIGTNGEIALGNAEWMMCCAASAGPSFEGSGVSCGMKASAGAIQRVEIEKIKDDFKTKYSVIKEMPPRGICGSGFIDLLAEMFRNRIIDREGKFIPPLGSIEKAGEELRFIIFKDDKNTVYITEQDIENLKRSKGAIYAASCILFKKVGMPFSKIKKIYIAGGFGRSLDIKNAITIGLLPDLKENTFEFVGNSSLAGARDVLLSTQAYSDVKKICRMMTYIDLSNESAYMEEYTKALFFPHTELERFRSIKF